MKFGFNENSNMEDGMINAVLFKSERRFSTFKDKLAQCGVNISVLDFSDPKWITYDYCNTDIVIYFSSFRYSSNHPLALREVYDNLMYIHSKYPQIKMFPDPRIIKYYNDKYKQFLFLKGHNFPIPDTIPLFSDKAVDMADRYLGYPMIIKNRYGAGGGSVFKISDRKELKAYYNLSKLNLFNFSSLKYFMKMISQRDFYYYLIKEKQAEYPFFSEPLLAQRFVQIDRDLKTVVGNYKVIEGHWRIQADPSMWKMNIDGGGVGEWSHIPDEAIELSVRLAMELQTSWINLDLIMSKGKFLITEFSPVWHHYAYQEKPSFVYKDDYNIDIPLEISLDLERIIVESLIRASNGNSLEQI